MITGNKGEWSELYVLLSLLAYGRIHAADEQLNRIENTFFPILRILREEIKGEHYDYRITSEEFIEIYHNDEFVQSVSREYMKEQASYLYQEITNGSNRAFEIEEIQECMEKLYCTKLSAPSTDKTDITMQIHDIQTGYEPICGFSIKSELGNPPTLLNASKATNFRYRVSGISEEEMQQINNIDSKSSKIKDRMERILQLGTIEFDGLNNETFATNLMLLDSRMEELLAAFLLISYQENITDCEELIERLEEKNPLNFPKRGFYRFKLKKLFCSVALGMMPSKEWDGLDEANGGYIIVSSNGEVLAYHIYNRNFFEEYLIRNTRLERGSTSRHEFATLYRTGNDMYINLNLQVRFK